jgi:hypothetical protein
MGEWFGRVQLAGGVCRSLAFFRALLYMIMILHHPLHDLTRLFSESVMVLGIHGRGWVGRRELLRKPNLKPFKSGIFSPWPSYGTAIAI